MKPNVFLAVLLVLAAEAAFAQVSQGEKLAKAQCLQCQTLGQGEPHGVGPNLHGIFGRKAGGASGFKYSDGYIKALTGKTWDAKLLENWLADTQSLAPGNGMTYVQDDPRKRRQLIEYLSTLR